MKRRNFLAGLAASAAAALTWRPGAAARSDSGESGDQSIAATNVKPDGQVLVAQQDGAKLHNKIWNYRPGRGHAIVAQQDGDRINIDVWVNDIEGFRGPLEAAAVFVSNYNEDGLACVRSWGFTDADGLFDAGQFPAGKMLLLQVRKDGWQPFEHRFGSFSFDGQGTAKNVQAVSMRRDMGFDDTGEHIDKHAFPNGHETVMSLHHFNGLDDIITTGHDT